MQYSPETLPPRRRVGGVPLQRRGKICARAKKRPSRRMNTCSARNDTGKYVATASTARTSTKTMGEVCNIEKVVVLLVGDAHHHGKQPEPRRPAGGLRWLMTQVADQEDSRENHDRQTGEAFEVGHHHDIDGASESEAECNRQVGARDRSLWHDGKRHRERIGEYDEPDRVRDVRHVKGDEPPPATGS